MLAVAQLVSRQPVIKLRLMLNRSYAAVIAIVLVVGMTVYSILYVIPQFLSGVSGYNAEQSGRVLFLSGIPAFILMPVLPRLLRLDLRVMVLVGLLCFAASCFLDTNLTAESSGGAFVFTQLLRGAGQILAFMPLNQASVGAVSRSLGLALLGVFIDRQSAAHAQSIGASVTANSPLAQAQMAGQAASIAAQSGGDLASGHLQAMAQLNATVQLQAVVMTYSDCFVVLGVALLAMIPLVFLLRPPLRGGGQTMAAH
jgi:DHA2 family multidrug resistance protein